MMDWTTLPDRSSEYRLELEAGDGSTHYPDGHIVPIKNYHASVRWDGCVDFEHHFNGYDWKHECEGEKCQCLADTIHICDVDAMIAMLLAIKVAARDHFKGTSGEGEWR